MKRNGCPYLDEECYKYSRHEFKYCQYCKVFKEQKVFKSEFGSHKELKTNEDFQEELKLVRFKYLFYRIASFVIITAIVYAIVSYAKYLFKA